jgi:hypothetical protein
LAIDPVVALRFTTGYKLSSLRLEGRCCGNARAVGGNRRPLQTVIRFFESRFHDYFSLFPKQHTPEFVR